ncbi:MAG TPA: RNA-directed DNA polymerase, partial [Chloroflexi bacterium]|nr:RNA-directed DNA polymerase [Chloroflexota bacterium]
MPWSERWARHTRLRACASRRRLPGLPARMLRPPASGADVASASQPDSLEVYGASAKGEEMDFLDPARAPHRELPPYLGNEYAELMGWFSSDPSTLGFRQMDRAQGLSEDSPRGVAHRACWWFPAHFFKFQDALLRWQARCNKSGEPFLLGSRNVTFLDLGCGAGAASAAILAVLEHYQGSLRSQGRRLENIKVHLLGVDQSAAELEAYRRLVGGYASRLRCQRIRGLASTLQAGFPADLAEILEALSGLSGHVLVIGMSNLVNWIWNDWQGQLAEGNRGQPGVLPSDEEVALVRLNREVNFDCVHVIGTATKSPVHLKDKLRQLFDRFAARLGGGEPMHGRRGSLHAAVLYSNPEYCGWSDHCDSYASEYYVENLIGWRPEYEADERLQQALSLESLETAWAKVRSYMRYESLTDEIELRLFEADLDYNLRALRAACLDRDSEYLNVQWSQPYEFPKTEASTRPRSVPRMEEQIVAVAIALEFARELEGPCKEVCYSYRLAPRESEFLYDYWFVLYRKCLSHALRQLASGYVLLADIKSYYTNVSQSILLRLLRGRLRPSSRCLSLLTTSIDRHCGPGHDEGYGLVQGHAVSGLLGNVMLQPADWRLARHHGWGARYCRFTDDMTVTNTDGPTGRTRDTLEQELEQLDRRLQLNTGKTEFLRPDRFRKNAHGSRKLDQISKRFRAVLLAVFLLDRGHRAEFNRTEWAFAHKYQELLGGQGVYLTPEWLCRKLDEYGRLERRLRSVWRKWKLKWPPVSLLSTQSGRLA